MQRLPILNISILVVLFTITIHVIGDNSVNTKIDLINEPKCLKIKKWCVDLDDYSDLNVLECLQTVNSKDIATLKKDCLQAIGNHTEHIIENKNVQQILHSSCGNEIEKFNCDQPGRGNFFACVLDNREDLRNEECLKDIQRLESVAFFDLRWVTQFLQICIHDMEKLHCNTRETNREFLYNGKSLQCLQNDLKSLEPKCKKQVIKLTEIQADNIRLDPELYFSCAADRFRFCREFQPGTGLVFKCLMQHRFDDNMTEKCKEQLVKRENLIVQDYKVSKGLMRACREDIRKSHCRKQISDDKTIRLAQILLCLENFVRNGTKVSSSCEGEMIGQRRILMEDYRLSPEIVDGCRNDIEKLCSPAGVNGRTIHCLMEHATPRNRERITDVCQRALETLLKETDAGENWRVDPVLQEACQVVVSRACRGIHGGDSRVMSCLMDNLGAEYMTESCENALVQIQYFIARDFQLDPLLYRSCREDAINKCHARSGWSQENYNSPDNGPLILPCLYRYAYHENVNMRLKPLCFEQIKRVMRQRALSVDLQPEIEDKCIDELSMYCFDQHAKGEEIQCLQKHMSDLKEQCKLAVSNFTEEQAQHLELNPVIMTHCRDIIDRHCKDKKEEGDVMDCLIMHKNDPDVKSDAKCRAAVEHFQLISLKNYHFTYKFKMHCKPYVMRYCQSSRTKSDVITCLSEIVRNDTLVGARNRILKECRQQLRSQLYQQRENINFDLKLKEACQKDIFKHCREIESGSSQVLECLKNAKDPLTEKCQKQMFRILTQDMMDNSVDYTLVTMCHDMIKQFCESTEPSRILDCLKHYKEEPNFDKKCKHVVVHRLIEQSKDYRFNPKLASACNDEIGKFCSHILREQKPDQELEGKVTECLKRQFRKSNLNSPCEAEMSEILREQALNYNLNPLLKTMCQAELETICKFDGRIEDASGQVEECLKNAFLKKTVLTTRCRQEVASLIEESEADIHVDPLLQKACTADLLRYCGSVTQGSGKQLKCLEVIMSELNRPMEPECKNMLSKRIEMFKNAAIIQAQPPDDIGQLYAQVSASPARRYFMILGITFVGFIFFIGLFCGRVTRRARSFKNK